MKHNSILSLLIFLLGLGATTATTTSCEDMLTPDMDRYSEGFSGNDTVYFYLGILRNVQDMVEQNELLSDLRSDLVTTTTYSSDSVADIINYNRQLDGENRLLNRSAYYKVINQCNFYLAKADTNAVKNNIYYMRKEYSQVLSIRAWAYLQLVQTYGKVPFITKPVDNADTGWEKNPEAWADADNLVDLLKNDLEKAKTFEHIYGIPEYGTMNNGTIQFNSTFMRFYSDLVLGDLYLLRGRDRNDYVEAAKNYYYVLNQKSKYEKEFVSKLYGASFFKNENSVTGTYSYQPSILSRISHGLDATNMNPAENMTVIPSAANSSFGRVLTSAAQIYGFDPHSTTSTSGSGDEVSQSGSITVTTNLKSRQVEPSQAYLNLCAAQVYSMSADGSTGLPTEIEYYNGAGDARKFASVATFETKDGKATYVTKYSPVSNVMSNGETFSRPDFKHFKSIYRLAQVYLRYAEAVNRAGFPRLAFTVLRDGLNYQKLPTLLDSVKVGDDGVSTRVYYLDSATVGNAANYIGVDELRRMKADPQNPLYLDFTEDHWQNDGIHELGCGKRSIIDSLNSYEVLVSQRILDEAARANALTADVQRLAKKIRSGVRDVVVEEDEQQGGIVEPEIPAATQEEINAVETLIADECALEMAYEGTRMFDLMRFARHMNNTTADAGTKWLAWKIARRNEKLAPYESPKQYDNRLYNLLMNPENWFIQNPVY